MPEFSGAREQVLGVLQRELVGPDPQGDFFDIDQDLVDAETAWLPRRQAGTGEEILTRDGPDRRYGVGVLYSAGGRAPSQSRVAAGDGPPEEPMDDASPDLATSEFLESVQSAGDEIGSEPASDDLDLSGANDYRPSTLAVTFLAELPDGSEVRMKLAAGRYRQHDIDVAEWTRTWWFRSPCSLDTVWDGTVLRTEDGRHTGRVSEEGLGNLEIRTFAVSRPRDDGKSLITVGVTNATPGATPENFLFQTEFEVWVTYGDSVALVHPYPKSKLAARDEEEQSIDLLFRAYPTYAIGHGCAAGWDADSKHERGTRIFAQSLPVVETPSTTPQVFREDGSELTVPMAPLAGLVSDDDGIESLEQVISLYENWIATRVRDVERLDQRHHAAARRHLQECNAVAGRMREGLAMLAEAGPVREAFVLANRAVLLQQVHSVGTTRELTYDRDSRVLRLSGPAPFVDALAPPPGRGSWRPFQIAFLLAAIPSCAEHQHPDRELVDLIFFPTGGGKTEAYLGLAAFTIILRRLRDVSDVGVEVLMRYTLRLLTAQQFQRAAALICALETIRAERPELGESPFSIGIWVGGDTTPNKRSQALFALRDLRKGRGSNPFLVIRCPWCAAQIGPLRDRDAKAKDSKAPKVYGYREVGGTVQIHCSDPACEFADGLPLYVIDEDIYDNPPSILIGTVDKFAQLTWRSDARSLFGLNDQGQQAVSPPGLIIQDELHLISGPLGSMVGLYEGVVEQLCVDRRLGQYIAPKIVSSTATIRRYADQVRALFARERVSLFPPHGLSVDDSYFASYARYRQPHERAGELQEGRMYVGVHGGGLGSLQTTQTRTFSALLQAGMDLPAPRRDPYWTLMVFFNSLRELGTSLSLLQSDIPDYMKAIRNRRGSSWDEVRRLNRELELTGRLQHDEVPAVMEALESRYDGPRSAVDVCLASNIIEVGIDIDRLSLMTVVGQPKSTSQYIQVTGRVGRRWSERPGLIVSIYSATKPRDRSHYEQFRTYHERLYAQVEPTSVTPFASPVLMRSLHAALVAWVRQCAPVAEAESPYPFPYQLTEDFRRFIRSRVAVIDDEESEVLDRILEMRLEEWRRWDPRTWRRASAESEPGLLYAAGDYVYPEERHRSWATPTSLRNVDAECLGVITGIYALEKLGD